MIVQITQFIRPNGKQMTHTAIVHDELKANYEAMQACGCRLAAEVLRTGEVSCTIEHTDGDVAIKVVKNLPGIPTAAIETMLREFNPEAFEQWHKAQMQFLSGNDD